MTLGLVASLRERQTVADQIFGSLRDAIRTGVLKDGDELNQVGIAEHFGVSRVPVREALRSLEAEGWIKAPTNQRAFVQELNTDEIAEIFDLRELLETELVGKLVGLVEPSALDQLEALCDEMDGIFEHDRWVSANGAFHRQLLLISGRRLSVDLIERLTSQIERYLRLRRAGPERQSEANIEHRAIIDAIRAGDARKARSLMRNHIRTTRKLTLNALNELRSSATQAKPLED